MGSNRLFSSSVHGHISGEASRGYTCTEKYEWQNLTLCQSVKTAREKPHHVANLNCPLHIPSRNRIEDSLSPAEISFLSKDTCGLHGTGGETVINRCCSFTMCGVKMMGERTASHDHGHSSKHRGPANGVGGPCPLSYGECRGQGHACLKRAQHNISPGPGPITSYRNEQSPSFNLGHYAKGADRQIHNAVSFRNNFPVNHGSDSHNIPRHEDRYLQPEVDFPGGHFSQIDAARHRSYLQSCHAYSKHKRHYGEDPMANTSDRTSHGRSHQRYGFRAIHREQLELSPKKDLRKHVDRSRNFRNAYNGKMSKRKCIRQGARTNTDNGACGSKYDRKSSRKRNTDQLQEKKDRTILAYEHKSKRFCCPNEQDQQLQAEPNNSSNDDSQEGNIEITEVCQNEAKENCNAEKNARIAPPSIISMKCDGTSNVCHRYSSKTIASSRQKPSEDSNNMEPESDKKSKVDGCTERGILQHPSVTPMGKVVHGKESCHSEVLRDCLNIWRRLRKDSGAEADKIVKTDQQQTEKATRVSVGRRVTNVRVVACSSSESSESDDEDGSALKSSEQSSTAMPSDRLKKSGEGRVNRKLECPLMYPSTHQCNKSPQNTRDEKRLMCNLELPSESNPGKIAQQKELENLLCYQLSTDQPVVQSTLYGCSGPSKMDQAVVSHCDNTAHQNVCQQEADIVNLDERTKDKLGLRCETKKKAECRGAKLGEQNTSFYTAPTPLDQRTVARCSMHDNSKVSASEFVNHDSRSTTIDGSILDRGNPAKCQTKPVNHSDGSYYRDVQTGSNRNDCTDIQHETKNPNTTIHGSILDRGNPTKCQTKSVNHSDGSYCRDVQTVSNRNDCTDIQQETKNPNILRKKQDCSALADSENEKNHEASEEECHAPQALEVEITSNQQTSHQGVSGTVNSSAANQGHRTSYPLLPDLNCLPSLDPDEDFIAPKELVRQVTSDFKPQSVTKSLSGSLYGPTTKDGQLQQAETNQLVRQVCEKGTSESGIQLQISDSNTGPLQLSTVEESITSSDAFKLALYDFMRNILKPLWENGLLSREIFKLIMNKAATKVINALGPKVPSTDMAISIFISNPDESRNLQKLVQGYLDVYVGKEVLKRAVPGSFAVNLAGAVEQP
ncbi:hypothetical protein ACP70R_024938 [Stipagrostis hirtigluma subsp. patula]